MLTHVKKKKKKREREREEEEEEEKEEEKNTCKYAIGSVLEYGLLKTY